MVNISNRERVLGGLWGAVVGDALGVPVEFEGRHERKENPVKDMQGYGTFNLPPGSWSDDSSLMFCTVLSLCDGFDTNVMGQFFIRWLTEAFWTPYGTVFDVGYGTLQAINRVARGIPAERAGGTEESNNGNGSLMRILPVGIFCDSLTEKEILDTAHRASSITHGHPRSLMACGIYCLMIRELLKAKKPWEAYARMSDAAKMAYGISPFSFELPHFTRFFNEMKRFSDDTIKSDGYVVHTLEAAFWCFLTTGSYREAVLKAINLGDDTDTTAIVTGGLAGINYGLAGIPQEWIRQIARRNDIEDLFLDFTEKLSGH
jgi:ADP-ribosyl-[dinitrogen reductase] hydrolase